MEIHDGLYSSVKSVLELQGCFCHGYLNFLLDHNFDVSCYMQQNIRPNKNFGQHWLSLTQSKHIIFLIRNVLKLHGCF